MALKPDDKLTDYESICLFAIVFLSHLFSEAMPVLTRSTGPAAWLSRALSVLLAFSYLGVDVYKRQIMDWLEGRMDQEAESDFLARQASDAELAEECRQLEELLGALADLDEDLIPPASFHESVMRGVRAEAAGSEEAGPATLVAGVRGQETADAQRLNRPNAAAKAPFPGPDGGEGPGKEKRLTLFQRLRLGTVLPVAACLLALVIACLLYTSRCV